jgi:hypothetical protein
MVCGMRYFTISFLRSSLESIEGSFLCFLLSIYHCRVFRVFIECDNLCVVYIVFHCCFKGTVGRYPRGAEIRPFLFPESRLDTAIIGAGGNDIYDSLREYTAVNYLHGTKYPGTATKRASYYWPRTLLVFHGLDECL